VLGWHIILAASTPDSAALVRTAQAHIEGAGGTIDWAEVRRMARRALRANPLETRAVVLLGLAAEADGDVALAGDLMSLASARTLRDRTAHAWLFDVRLNEGNFAAALDHADVLLRAHPRLKPALLPWLMATAAVPAGRAAIVERLEAGPPWRGWFLAGLSRHAADPSGPTPVYTALQAGPRPPLSAELRPHLERLIGAGRYEQAMLVWLASLPPQDAASLDYLHNGSFDREITNLAFDWVIGRVRGADIDVTASPSGAGKALRVRFGKARVPLRHVRKLMTLPPGAYELSGKAMAVDLRNARGVQWRLACADGQRDMLASTPRITGTVTAEFAEPFTVPSQGCRAQWLHLELAARIAPEQDVDGGTVWFEALQVRRAAPAARSTMRKRSAY
jgi:hypothetical protein